MNKRKILLIMSFFVIILFGIIFTNTKKDVISNIDNKQLYNFEDNSTIRDKLKSSEYYLSDRLGFRNELVSLYMNFNDRIFNTVKNPLYDYGLNEELYFKFTKPNEDEEFVENFFNFLLDLQDFYEERNIEFLFVLEPKKNEIYSEFVPDYVHLEDYNYKKLIELIENSNLNYLNNNNALIEAKKYNRVYSKKSDVGHWTDDGAIAAINNIISELKHLGYTLDLIDLKNYNKEEIIDEYMPSSNLKINEKIIKYRLKDKHFANFFDEKEKDVNNPIVNYNMKIWNEISINNQHRYFDIMENYHVENNYNLLFFRGSYFTDKEKFIGELFHKVTAVHNYQNLLEPEYYTNFGKPDIVILELAQGTISPNYFNNDKVLNKKFSKPYSYNKNNPVKELENSIIEINSNNKEVLIDLEISLNDIFDSAYIKLDDIIYDINLNNENTNTSNFFTSILKEDFGNNNDLILVKNGTNYIFNLNNILNK